MSLIQCSILLLAGGRGQRMGGQDKGLVTWQGQPLIAYAQRVARPLTDDLIISCNRNPDQYARFADQLVTDGNDDFAGPLAGIRAGLAAARHAHLLVLPCDVPNIDRDLLLALLGAAAEHPERPLMVRHGEHWEPLLCVIPTALKDAFDTAWQAGERSPRKIMLQLNAQAWQCAENDVRLTNFNTADLLK
ncbi:molybdenum cofactor guanylyltransferase MobA [Pseudomonas fragi]|uniref:Molybdenum cofactor guanylyltransferase n=1 Tax=Pseudomonas fragi TaxID=296 RepID=A0A9Q6VJS7_PSEFR|nr:molybdenum cofactor guanylyltransferase MobA [Pseudomonas fragi]QPL30483.1 molybdenum cofactor guanylyltransferase MobA [Pseudomonas fragi]